MLYHLRTNHRENPVGIDGVPEFSWMWESDREDVLQTSYSLVVCAGGRPVWQTGEIRSNQQSFVPYGGESLQSRTLYTWTVTVVDNHGDTDTASATFETGLLKTSDWSARWVEARMERPEYEQPPFWKLSPPVLFEKTIELSGAVASARLYATAHGIYRAELNGTGVSDAEFAPEHTVYDKVLYYQTYPVESLLREGENTLTFTVADGWYHCPQTRQDMREFSEFPGVFFQLEVTFVDGRTGTYASDGSETCCMGATRYADLYIGEKQDHTTSPTPPVSVSAADFSLDNLAAQPMEPVRAIMTLPAVSVTKSPAGEWIVDFVQNVCGRVKIHADLPAGTELIVDYFEETDLAGNYKNTFFAPQKEIFVSDGEDRVYESRFTFHGFRYLRVSGPDAPKAEEFTAVVLTTEKESLGTFSCSDDRLVRLWQNIRWSQTNNMLSVPTDCPTREKGGFTGDIQIYAKTALLNEQMTPFLTAWLRNLTAAQGENGAVPITVPETAPYKNLIIANAKDFGDEPPVGVAGWGDAAVIVPYMMYRMTGNKEIIKQQFESMTLWCEYIIRTAESRRGDMSLPEKVDRTLWNTGFHFGEWLIPSEPKDMSHREACEGSAYYTAPIFGYISLYYMAELCRALNRPEEARYEEVAVRMKWAIQKALIRDGKLKTTNMGAYVLMIAFDLVPDDCKKSFSDTLVDLLEQNDGKLDTGFLATPYLLDAFTRIGRKDLAVSLLWQTKMPSWLYEVEQGATTIWESWDAKAPGKEPEITSYDHYAFGCVDAWIMEEVVGLRALEPGFRRFEVRPEPDLLPLQYCERSLLTEYGTIAVRWDHNTLCVTVPCGTAADISWKGKIHTVGSGDHTFR